jgi:hypothetical protein
MAAQLAIAKDIPKQVTRKRDRIMMIEAMPTDKWFVRARTNRGREVWYLRFEVTGQHPQLFGPFKSKHQCLLFLDDALDALPDFNNELRDACEKRMLSEKCQKIWPPIIEHPLLTQRRSGATGDEKTSR